MRRAVTAMAMAAALGLLGGAGCFASWSAVQLSGSQRYLEEGGGEVNVPRPGVKEVLLVHLPLAVSVTYAANATTPTPRVFELGCGTLQHAQNDVHRSTFRYGKKWKYATATMFVLEAAVATATYYGDRENVQNRLTAGVLAIDAIGTAALFFAPRKEVFRTEVRDVSARVREDCPEGLVLDIGGESFPVDAAGRIGELGIATLDAWMQAPNGAVRVSYGSRTVDLQIGELELCGWNRAHHPDPADGTSPASPANPANPANPDAAPVDPANPGAAPADPAAQMAPASPGAAPPAPMASAGPGTQRPLCPRYGALPPRQVSAIIDVPVGTLTRLDAAPAAPAAPAP